MDHSSLNIFNKLLTDYFAFIVIATRFFGAMSIFPILSADYFSRILKILLSFSFAMIIFPSLHTQPITDAGNIVKFFFIFKEYFIGFMMGFILSTPIWIIQGAGQFIDNQRGEQMGALISKISQSPSSSVGSLLLQSFVVYFLTMNGLVFFAGIIYKSFGVFPVDQFLPTFNPHVIENYIDIFKNYVMWTILLAMPVIVLMFIVEIVLGLLSTFLPQMNVTVLSLPIKSCVGIFVVILYINNLYQFVLIHFLDKIKGVYA